VVDYDDDANNRLMTDLLALQNSMFRDARLNKRALNQFAELSPELVPLTTLVAPLRFFFWPLHQAAY
jgi:hypothetical protein